ncbi:hypothetical protein BIW11_05940 [Tropilaelaps mercedesae]|uniref:Uncharacterized protein n=1 Tax=Tropilaelaps mercedesae TaxID=418985 RepID=A0A1V9Y0C0_9ACAR|nr:hypothetical protein BIW11_05940 [Tropilaelaps mercedesae]
MRSKKVDFILTLRLRHAKLTPRVARWLIPCRSCSDGGTSCAWDEARWTYPDCQHVPTPRVVLQHCLSNTKILFLGDSTLRGMMFEAVQQLNGSLARWEKAHDVAIYNQTNRGHTTFAFAYYPKFWRRKLPSFELTLKRLIDK